MKLSNKVAVITGAGAGFGRACSLLFAEEGAKVVVADINKEAARETVEMIKKKGGEAVSVEADVSKATSVAAMIKAAVDAYGKVDVLFNNAGIPQLPTPVEDLDEGLWDRIMGVNLKSIFLGAKYAFPVMKKQGGGVIINTASISGKRPRPGSSAYATSKGAAIFLTKALAIEGAPHKIRVNSIIRSQQKRRCFRVGCHEGGHAGHSRINSYGSVGYASGRCICGLISGFR
jgi:3-oxoacyl-[acyl-carrier protein] reductase